LIAVLEAIHWALITFLMLSVIPRREWKGGKKEG
jgi:hypothetical protein